MNFMSEKAVNVLTKKGIVFDVKNDGIQLVIEGINSYIDYYPTTGKWLERKPILDSNDDIYIFEARKGFSLKKLLKYIKGKK